MELEQKEEKPQGRFKKYNYEIKEEPIKEKKEEEVIEPKKNNTYFGRLSRRLLESKKEREKEKEKKEEIIEKVEEKPKTLSRYDRFSYKPKFKNEENVNNNKYKKEEVTEKITTTTIKSKYSPYSGKTSTITTTTNTVTNNDGKSTFTRKRYHYTGSTQEEPKEEPKAETKVETKKETPGFRRYRFGIKK